MSDFMGPTSVPDSGPATFAFKMAGMAYKRPPRMDPFELHVLKRRFARISGDFSETFLLSPVKRVGGILRFCGIPGRTVEVEYYLGVERLRARGFAGNRHSMTRQRLGCSTWLSFS